MTDLGGYVAVFAAAATPWLEILLVIPPGVAAGLDPVVVAFVAFAGNALPVIGIVLAGDRLVAWWDRRREASPPSRRTRRARRVLDRWGVPGLALLGPLVTGTHLAAMIALTLRPDRGRVIGWMCASLAVWSLAITVVSVLGVDLLRA